MEGFSYNIIQMLKNKQFQLKTTHCAASCMIAELVLANRWHCGTKSSFLSTWLRQHRLREELSTSTTR